MNNEKRTCDGCLWKDQCESDKRCGYYTPINPDEEDIKYYQKILKENAEEYDSLVKEQDNVED